MELLIIMACLLGLYVFREREPYVAPTCRKCGAETVYHEGLGAGVEMCPKCDVL
jgi:hypothetical protein